MLPIWSSRLEHAPDRVDHASAAVGHIIYSFGGYCNNDVWTRRQIVVDSIDTNTLEWSSVAHTHDSTDDVPFNRFGHTVIADGYMIYLWGGVNYDSLCNVLFAFNCVTLKWSRPKVSGVTPDARFGHSAALCGRKMYIFGGDLDGETRRFQDVHSLDLDTFIWTYIVTDGMPPTFTQFHSLSCIDEILYVFGGRSNKEGQYGELVSENEIACLDLRSLTWSRPVTKNTPIGRESHSSFVFNNWLYIFGGFNGLTGYLNDLDMYNPITREWTKVSTQGVPPGPCAGQSCHLVKSQVFLFGGAGRTENFTDLFVLDFSPSLETLAKHVIIKHGLSTTSFPSKMKKEISYMPKKTTQKLNQ